MVNHADVAAEQVVEQVVEQVIEQVIEQRGVREEVEAIVDKIAAARVVGAGTGERQVRPRRGRTVAQSS